MNPIDYISNPAAKNWLIEIHRRGAAPDGGPLLVETVQAAGDAQEASRAVEKYLRTKGWVAEKYLFFHEVRKMRVLLYPSKSVAKRVEEQKRVAPITTTTPRSCVLRDDHERLIIRAAQMLDFGSPMIDVVTMLQRENVPGDERFLIIKGAEVLRGHRQPNPVKRGIRWMGKRR